MDLEAERRVARAVRVRRAGELQLVASDVSLADQLVQGDCRTIEFQLAEGLQRRDLHLLQGAIHIREVEVRLRDHERRVLGRGHSLIATGRQVIHRGDVDRDGVSG